MARPGTGRGGKGGHEPRAQVRLRELQVIEQLLQGQTQHEIATTLGITQPAVSRIAKRMEQRLLADLATEVQRHRARHTLRLQHIYGEAMAAWERSKTEVVRRRQRKTEGGAGSATTVAELVSENRHGDPRYLDEARKALTDIRKLWGLDAPDRITVSPSPYAALSDEALDAELRRYALSLPAGDVVPPAAGAVPRPRRDAQQTSRKGDDADA